MHRPLIFRTREAAYDGLSETRKRLKLKRNKVMYVVKPHLLSVGFNVCSSSVSFAWTVFVAGRYEKENSIKNYGY